MTMKVGWACVLALVLSAPAAAQSPGKPVGRPTGKAVATSTISAIVQNVDLARREVTLKEGDGAPFVISVGPEVKNLADVKKDDLVMAKLTQTLAWQVAAPGQAPRPVKESATGDLGKAGERPMGVREKTTTGTVTVTAMDRKARTITVKEPGGKSKVLEVHDAKNLDLLKVGDNVDVTYTESLAVMVEKAPKK